MPLHWFSEWNVSTFPPLSPHLSYYRAFRNSNGFQSQPGTKTHPPQHPGREHKLVLRTSSCMHFKEKNKVRERKHCKPAALQLLQNCVLFQMRNVNTHKNTSAPQPATAVKIRGPRSRAGLTAYPQLKPIERPITETTRPTVKGSRPRGTGLLYGSTMARMQTINEAVPMS